MTELKKLTSDEIKNTVAQLMAIEQKASAVLSEVKRERAAHNKRVRDEIERRKAKLNADTEKEISDMRVKISKETELKLAEINTDCEKKIKAIKDGFTQNGEAWRRAIYQNILAGI